MITLKDSIEIKTTPKKIFEWFAHFEENFRAWYPNHVQCCWLIGKLREEDLILYVGEHLHGKLHKIKFLITKIEPNRKIEYKLLFPTSIFCPKGSFIIKPKRKGRVSTVTLSFRFGCYFQSLRRMELRLLKNICSKKWRIKRILEGSQKKV